MRRRQGEAGFTLLEVTAVAGIFVIAAGGIMLLNATMERHARISQEFELAEETTRRVVEGIRYLGFDSFPNLVNLLDDDPSNDPDGMDAPGNTYATGGIPLTVPGLVAASDSPTGQLVEIILHTDETEVNASMGLPRDLNGDGDMVDTNVNTSVPSFVILPITVRIHWSNENSPGSSLVNTMQALIARR